MLQWPGSQSARQKLFIRSAAVHGALPTWQARPRPRDRRGWGLWAWLPWRWPWGQANLHVDDCRPTLWVRSLHAHFLLPHVRRCHLPRSACHSDPGLVLRRSLGGEGWKAVWLCLSFPRTASLVVEAESCPRQGYGLPQQRAVLRLGPGLSPLPQPSSRTNMPEDVQAWGGHAENLFGSFC